MKTTQGPLITIGMQTHVTFLRRLARKFSFDFGKVFLLRGQDVLDAHHTPWRNALGWSGVRIPFVAGLVELRLPPRKERTCITLFSRHAQLHHFLRTAENCCLSK